MVMCGHGEQAMTGASLRRHRGHHDVVVLDGGPDTWSTETDQPLAVGS
jgi:rhodanese-related sulfurtransferase